MDIEIKDIDLQDKHWFAKYMPHGITITLIPKEDVIRVEDFEPHKEIE